MRILFIVNSLLSAKTAVFWKKNRARIFARFPDAEVLSIDGNQSDSFIPTNEYEVFVLVGGDEFFHMLLNHSYEALQSVSPHTPICFLPDSNNSALACSLGLPKNISEIIELIYHKNQIPMDLVRCHCIDMQGHPRGFLVLNDALIRLPQSRMPLFLKTMVQWFRTSSGFFTPSSPNQITLLEQGKEIYKGNYLFAILLLGNRITRGPKLRNKTRFLQSKFSYFQLNAERFSKATKSLPKLFSGEGMNHEEDMVKGMFQDLELKGIGDENVIVADGVCIGRLPASFTLLPKAIRVISPLLAAPLVAHWKVGEKKEGEIVQPVNTMNNCSIKRDSKRQNRRIGE